MEKSITKNYFFNLIKTISDIVFPLITFAYTSRMLGADGLGKISFAKSTISYFSMIAMLGIGMYGTREAAKVRDNRRKLSKFAQEILIINFCTTLLSYILLIIAFMNINKLQEYTVLIWVNSISIALMSFGMEWLYQALEEYQYIAKRAVLFRIIGFCAMFIWVRDRRDVVVYAIILVISSTGAYVLNLFNARKYIDFKPIGEYELKRHIAPMMWLFALAISTEINTILDSTMLGFFCSDTSVGLYNAAIKVNRMVVAIITPLGAVIVPRLSYYIGKREGIKFQELINKVYNCIFIISIPAAIGLYVLSDDIIRLFCGAEYQSAGLTMRIMTWIVILIPFSYMTNNQTLVPLGKERLIFLSTGLGSIVNFVCNCLLIPRYAENGAAIATVAAETVIAGVCLCSSIKFLDMRRVFKYYYQYWCAAIPIIFISWFIKRLGMNYIIEMIVIMVLACLLYVWILYLFKNRYVFFAINGVCPKVDGRIKLLD